VFASEVGTELHAANVRRGFRRIAKTAGLVAVEWTPRELRHSFVSLLSDGGLRIEQISRLVGHSSTAVTETVYRHQLSPVVEDGATAMDRIFLQSRSRIRSAAIWATGMSASFPRDSLERQLRCEGSRHSVSHPEGNLGPVQS
jgi:hypothetical protein